MSETEIGAAAGRVWEYLEQNGMVTLTKLRRELDLQRGRVDQALGWLAREDKVLFSQDRRTTLVSLKRG